MKQFIKTFAVSILLSLFAILALGLFSFLSAKQVHAKTLVVGTDITAPPFEFKKDGKYTGFDIELWQEIAKRLGLEYILKPVSFDGLIPGLQSGAFDVVIAGVVIRPDRAKVVDFSIPYYISGISILTKKESNIETMNDLNGKVVTLKVGTTPTIYLKEHVPFAELKLFQNLDASFLDVVSGGADAAVYDTPILQYFAKVSGDNKLKVVGHVDTDQHFGIVYPKGSELVDPVNKTLRAMKADGAFDTLYQKWFGEAPPVQLLN